MQRNKGPGPDATDGFWLDDAGHRRWLLGEAGRLFDVFGASLRPGGGFAQLDLAARPLPDSVDELHATTRMVHSYSLGLLAGRPDAGAMVDAGMRYLWQAHRDADHGGYLWAVKDGVPFDDRKLAYGHVFVLLAAASARMAGHPDADRLLDDVWAVLEAWFWDDEAGLYRDEWTRDWAVLSAYRGMNANMHAAEALLAAHEATGREVYLERAGRILAFFLRRIAPRNAWRLPEHYDNDWQIDRAYAGDPVFRPAGTTPGHSFEMARLLLQHWDLVGRPGDGSPDLARALVKTALTDGWNRKDGGLAYTLDFDGRPAIADRLWWPVTEAIGAVAALIKLERDAADEIWYRRLWSFADAHFIDHEQGGWFAEIDAAGRPVETRFRGKPDIYHALQAALLPAMPGLSRAAAALPGALVDERR